MKENDALRSVNRGSTSGPWALKVGVAMLALLAVFWGVNAWLAKPVWEDGKYRIYSIDGKYRLGVFSDPGYFALVDEQVVAVGSNDAWVVARQVQGGKNSFYILKKPLGNEFPKDPEGPLTEEQYGREVVARGLPPFAWKGRSTES